ncbi:MAG: sucrase ferredoxin [Nocardioidaceae bacterium]
MTDEFRCSLASLAAAEPLAGTAPTETAWLLVEDPGPWGRKALAESRLPEAVRDRLAALDGVRVQLVRRHGERATAGVQVFAATAGADGGFAVEAARLDDAVDLLSLDLEGLAAGRGAGLSPYDAGLWLVCTNGRRDRCCAEQGRPVAAALTERWPDQTWETTHLGGHRFAATLLALPSGATLGRLDPSSAVAACAALEKGDLLLDLLRGRAGTPAAAQAAEAHLRDRLSLTATDAVRLRSAEPAGDETLVTLAVRTDPSPGDHRLLVTHRPGTPHRLSCADDLAKPTDSFHVTPAP